MSAVSRSILILVSCMAVSAACTSVPPVPMQSAETSPAESPSAAPRPTRTAGTTQAPSPTVHVPLHTPPPPTATYFPEEQLHAVTNYEGSITAVIPTVWTDVRSLEWKDERDAVIGHTLVASTDVERFLDWEAEGVSISVSRDPGTGYVQLLDTAYSKYTQICNNTFQRYWDWSGEGHRGKYFVLDDCAGVPDSWLSVLSVVPQGDSYAYVAEVLAYDLIPIFGEDFRNVVMRFEVFPEKLP